VADTDEEQLEAIKKWWDENGTSMLVGIVAALAIVFGYQGWQNRLQDRGEAASALYEDLVEAVVLSDPFSTLDEEQLTTGQFLAAQLKDEYTDTSYAHFAAMFMAKLAVEGQDYETAEQELNWSLENGVDDSLRVIVSTRLARVKIAQGEHEAALALLAGIEPGEHKPSVEEARGDAYAAIGDSVKAREAYQMAVKSLAEGDTRPMLQMKLDDLVAPATVVPNEPGATAEPEDGSP